MSPPRAALGAARPSPSICRSPPPYPARQSDWRTGVECDAWALRPVAPEQVVGVDPLLGDDRRAERQLAAQDGRGDDLGELVDLPRAAAAEELEALALRGEPGAAPVGRDDQGWDRDRDVVVAVGQHLAVVER